MLFQFGFMDCYKIQNVIQFGFIKFCFKIIFFIIGLMEYYIICKNVILIWIFIVCVLLYFYFLLMYQLIICNIVRQIVEQCFELSFKVKIVCYSSLYYRNEIFFICIKVDNNYIESIKRKIYWYLKILNYYLKWYLYVQFNYM